MNTAAPIRDPREPEPSVQHQYVHDEPWKKGEPERLGRRGFAERIAQTIGRRRDPAGLVVALYGAWGEGKTSVLRMVEEDLGEFEDIVVVNFNPWRFHDVDHLVTVFFEMLAYKLGGAVQLRTHREVVGDSLRRYSKLLKPVPYAGEVLEAVGEHIGEPSLEELRTRVEAGIREAGIRPVIFIDDLDRLEGDEIRAVIRLVKLTAGFENTTYVLAFDPDFVAAALAIAVGGDQPTDGRKYLEKIVQVPLQLPATDQQTLFVLMLEHLNDAIRDVDAPFPEGDQQAYVRYVQPLFQARRRTIREAKRYANAVGFVLPLLAGEVNVGDLLLLEALRAWYPDVHGRLLDHRELLIGDRLGHPPLARESVRHAETVRAEWEEILSGLNTQEKAVVSEALEHLFPFVLAITRNTHHGSEWLSTWDKAQRAAGPHYFDRYFQYAVPRTDVADRQVQIVETALSAGNLQRVTGWLREEAERGATSRLIDKLSVRVAALTPRAAETFARALAATGDLYRDTGGFLSGWLSPEASAARLVRACILRLPIEARLAFAVDLARETPSLRFAVAVYQWLRAFGTEQEQGTAPLPEEEERRVGAVLAARLDAEHQRSPLYRWEPPDERRKLLEWWGILCGGEHTRPDLAARLSADPSQAGELLLPFRSHGWGMETGLPTPDMLGKHDYEAVVSLIDPDVVLAALRQVYGESLRNDEYHPPAFTTLEEAVAHQFAFEHRRALEIAARNASATEAQASNDRLRDEGSDEESGVSGSM